MTQGTIVHTAKSHEAKNPLDGAPMSSIGGEQEGEDYHASLEEKRPYTPLGFSGQHYHLLNMSGEMVSLTPTQLDKLSVLASLVHGDIAWFKECYPSLDVRYEFDRVSAYNALMMECHAKGFFDPAQHKLRKTGIWRVGVGDGSKLLAHMGNHIYFNGARHPPGYQRDGAYYLISNTIPKMADSADAANIDDCRAFLKVVETWGFTDSQRGAQLWFGWAMMALYGGAPEWRVHAMISSENGSGKSWLARLLNAFLGGLGEFVNDATEAGIRQSTEGKSGAIIYDEMEGDGDSGGGSQRVVELIRRMSDGEGAVTSRGSAGGKSTKFVVQGVAYLAAILPPILEPQDMSRFITLHLGPLAKEDRGAQNEAAVEAMMAQLPALSPRFRRRAFDHWPHFLDSVEAYKDSFSRLGVRARDAKRFAFVLAGRDVGLYDEMLEGDYYDMEAELYLPLIKQSLSDGIDGEGAQCLSRLLQMPLSMLKLQDTRTIGEHISYALNDSKHSRDKLSRMGLRVISEYEARSKKALPPGLLVANSHPRLEEIFGGTKWANKQWRQALQHLPEAEPLGKTVAFAGEGERIRQKATFVPIDYLPMPEPEQDEHDPV